MQAAVQGPTTSIASSMQLARRGVVGIGLLLPVFCCISAEATFDSPIASHPRILAGAKDHEMSAAAAQTDPAAMSYKRSMETATIMETEPGKVHSKGGNAFNIRLMAQLWQLTKNESYAARGVAEMGVACKRANWGGPTFLLTASYTTGVAIGLDWMFDYIDPANRTSFQQCLVEKGINDHQYAHYSEDFSGFTNRNIVGHGGYLIGALAIWDYNKSLAVSLINRTLSSMNVATQMYGPDGAWWEGFVYWGYATQNALMIRQSLLLSFGSDFGFLSNAPSFNRTGDFPLYSFTTDRTLARSGYGPTGQGASFNWADANVSNFQYGAVPMWLHKVFPNPAHAFLSRQMISDFYKCGDACANDPAVAADMLLFWNASGTCSDVAAQPLDRYFKSPYYRPVKGSEPENSGVVGVFKSEWFCANNDTEGAKPSLYAGIKMGGAAWSHGHADVGSFVFDLRGVRWAEDLGLRNYEMKVPKGELAYRDSTAGHNTLQFNGANQLSSAV